MGRWLSVVVLLALALACSKTTGPLAIEPPEPADEIERVSEIIDWATLPRSSADSPPLILEAPDATQLPLTSLEARAVVQGPLAFTELHLDFRNPLPRRIEGRLSIVLPETAAVSRLAMAVGGEFQEGEVVEKRKATAAYEGYLHRAIDPALLDKADGNRFTARIFPIEARETKHIILSYSEELVGELDPYRLRLAGLDEIDRVVLRVISQEPERQRVLEFAREHFRPDRDFMLAASPVQAVRSGDLVVARVAVPAVRKKSSKTATVLVDTSASISLDAALDALGGVLEGVNEVTVVCFDQDDQEIYSGPTSGFGDAERTAIELRGAAGATNFTRALRRLKPAERLVILTDGLATLGSANLRAAAHRVSKQVETIVVGEVSDPGTLEALSGGPTSGVRTVAVPGSRVVLPNAVRAGKETLVYAHVPVGQAVRTRIGTSTQHVDPMEVGPALISRAKAAAEIRALLDGQPNDKARAKAIGLSLHHRVLTEFTSFLVLETEADYDMHGISRERLADILTVGEDGVETLARSAEDLVLRRSGQGRAGEVDPGWRPDPERRVIIRDSRITVVEKVYFADGTARIRPASHALLHEIAKVMNEHGLRVEVEGHTDATGSSASNLRLSRQRARAVVKFLVAAGVPRDNLVVRGYGDTRPIDTNNTAKGRERNRRVEFRLLDRSGARVRTGASSRLAPHSGSYAVVREHLEAGQIAEALAVAKKARAKNPRDRVALLALGDVLKQAGRTSEAARVYGSLIDLRPSSPEDARIAGIHLEALSALDVALHAYARAVDLRPDHATGQRMLAYALARAGRLEDAFTTIEDALKHSARRQAAVVREVLRGDLGLLAAAWLRDDPSMQERVDAALKLHDTRVAKESSIRFVLTWESDATDVDLDVAALRRAKGLTSCGGEISTGYGPECWQVKQPWASTRYRLSVHFARQGSMGAAIGKVQIIEHDGEGTLTFEDRPFVITNRGGALDLGTVTMRREGRRRAP